MSRRSVSAKRVKNSLAPADCEIYGPGGKPARLIRNVMIQSCDKLLHCAGLTYSLTLLVVLNLGTWNR